MSGKHSWCLFSKDYTCDSVSCVFCWYRKLYNIWKRIVQSLVKLNNSIMLILTRQKLHSVVRALSMWSGHPGLIPMPPTFFYFSTEFIANPCNLATPNLELINDFRGWLDIWFFARSVSAPEPSVQDTHLVKIPQK